MAKRRRTTRRRTTTRRSAPKALIPEPRAKTCSCGCGSRGLGWLFIILGLLYIGYDLGAFQWWTISWWSILFLVGGWMILKK